MANKVTALVAASHPGPCALVTAVGAVLGVALGYSSGRIVLLALVVLAGQLSIGWSNDWIDSDRDARVDRHNKPTVAGTIAPRTLAWAAFAAALATVLLGFSLGPSAGATNVVIVGMGWAYNAGLKHTLWSVIPYAISFGGLPALATLGMHSPHLPQVWVVLVGALLGAAAHFTNVLPDLADDARTGVRGLPHVLGPTSSGIIAFACLACAALLLAFGPEVAPDAPIWIGLFTGLAIAILGVVLTFQGHRTRLLMRLIMAAALIDVAMLALSGSSLAQ